MNIHLNTCHLSLFFSPVSTNGSSIIILSSFSSEEDEVLSKSLAGGNAKLLSSAFTISMVTDNCYNYKDKKFQGTKPKIGKKKKEKGKREKKEWVKIDLQRLCYRDTERK